MVGKGFAEVLAVPPQVGPRIPLSTLLDGMRPVPGRDVPNNGTLARWRGIVKTLADELPARAQQIVVVRDDAGKIAQVILARTTPRARLFNMDFAAGHYPLSAITIGDGHLNSSNGDLRAPDSLHHQLFTLVSELREYHAARFEETDAWKSLAASGVTVEMSAADWRSSTSRGRLFADAAHEVVKTLPFAPRAVVFGSAEERLDFLRRGARDGAVVA